MRVIILTIILSIYGLLIISYKDTKVIDCKIVKVTYEAYEISCDSEGKDILEFYKENWPEEWKDSTKEGDIVKVRISDNEMFPMKSCAVRAKEMDEKYNKRGSGQMRKPLQLPIDKDCIP